MKNKLTKILSIAIIILACILVIEAVFFAKKIMTQRTQEPVYVLIKVLKYADIPEKHLSEIDSLYIGYSVEPTKIHSIESLDDGLLIRAEGMGRVNSNAFYFEGQKFSLNQRVVVRGLLDSEGVIYGLGSN